MIDKRQIAQKMRNATCRVHGQKAKITVVGDSIQLADCCCETFKNRLVAISTEEAGQQAANAAVDMMTKAFKKLK